MADGKQARRMTAYSASDLLKMRLRASGDFNALKAPVEITVPRLSADAYGDLADLALALGRKGGTWTDARGETRPRRRFAMAAGGAVRDALCLPWLYMRHRQRALSLSRQRQRLACADFSKGGLYLRMDHNFDLVSGGSVAHTAGVINAFRSVLPRLTVVSTDQLPLVASDRDFHELTPHYRAGRNIPLFPALTYTDDVADWWQRSGIPQPSFIYARYSVGNYAGPLLRARLGVPYVCEYNGSAIWIARHWGDKPLYFEGVFQAVEDANLFGADLIVAVSDASKAELIERGYPADRILVNPNGVDADVYRPDVSGAAVRQRFGIGEGERVIGFVGTFGRWHGAEVLAAAFAELLATRPDLRPKVRLVLVGDGTTMPETRAILAAAGCLDRVVFAGVVPQSEGPANLAACDILASPHVPNADGSRFFGSPTKLFEYMAMGRAIVASKIEQIAEVLEDGRTALLVQPGDAKALASALLVCIGSAEMCEKLGRRARAEAVARYTWLEHSKRILEHLASNEVN
jgi:glycosyltransferase involved in cell wall biosynthesis